MVSSIDVFEFTRPNNGGRICYFLIDEQLNFNDAREKCSTTITTADSDLAWIPEQEAQQFVETTFQVTLNDPLYVSVHINIL